MRISLYQAARHLNVYPRTLAKWIDAGHLTADGTGQERTITVEEFNRFCRDREFKEYTPPGAPA